MCGVQYTVSTVRRLQIRYNSREESTTLAYGERKGGSRSDEGRILSRPAYASRKPCLPSGKVVRAKCSLSDGNYLIGNGMQPRSRSLIRAGYNIQIIGQDLASLWIRHFVIYFTKTGCQSIHVSVRMWPRISAQTAVHCLADSVQLELLLLFLLLLF
jgi:hypothetical protein